MTSYYEGLSGDSSSNCDDEDESDVESCNADDDDDDERKSPATKTASSESAAAALEASKTRCILHLDVDCFYGQCEHIDRGIPKDRPMAIGQKHIIVTSNYAARAYGVGKLESRDAALAKCPGLLIVEGSDLEEYRKHAWKIYRSFRQACQEECFGAANVAVSKGSGMDEMMADLSVAIDASLGADAATNSNAASATLSILSESNVYIYGERGTSETTVLTEDQSGASAVVVSGSSSHLYDNDGCDEAIQRRLHRAAEIAVRIRRRVLEETGFTTTLGISVNPLLAKLAGGLKKPHTVNVLYPWRAPPLLASMPLRKIPGIGSRTIKALNPCLVALHGKQQQQQQQPGSSSFWTCRDILQIPHAEATACLKTIQAYEKSAAEHCHVMFQKCRGLDDSPVVDDNGGLSKTVSVENSFRRGTMLTQRAVDDAMEDLYERLPRLLKERALWSQASVKAYPTTIRLTVRSVIKAGSSMNQLASLQQTQRRPFVTHSKQMAIDGQALMALDDVNGKRNFLRRIVAPLMRTLLPSAEQINVTRINVATTNFQDILLVAPTPHSTVRPSNLRLTQSPTCLDGSPNLSGTTKGAAAVSVTSDVSDRRESITASKRNTRMSNLRQGDSELLVVDPAVLAELPEDIAAEIRRAYPQMKVASTKRKRIDQFFAKK
jgi:nucleotidyltransferase/DNA polymerase involved in DNA repair